MSQEINVLEFTYPIKKIDQPFKNTVSKDLGN